MGFTAIPFDCDRPWSLRPEFSYEWTFLGSVGVQNGLAWPDFHNSRFGQNCYSAVLFRIAIREPHAPPTDPFRFRAESHRPLFAGRARRQHVVFVRADAARS